MSAYLVLYLFLAHSQLIYMLIKVFDLILQELIISPCVLVLIFPELCTSLTDFIVTHLSGLGYLRCNKHIRRYLLLWGSYGGES